MIKVENTEVLGWEHAIRGARNPMNSWEKSDSLFYDSYNGEGDYYYRDINNNYSDINYYPVMIRENDHNLLMRLAKAGSIEAKYRRMIVVYADVTAPLYWWKEFDTYKVGTAANSCSTMHKIHSKEFVATDFSFEHLTDEELNDAFGYTPMCVAADIIAVLNSCREKFLETKDKKYWWQMIQLLPSSYNQRRTVMLNYEVLANIYRNRKDHKLDEWRDFCKWIEGLPYSEIITLKENV